ncbi:MAG: ACT domain-containing protein [Pseudomonadales bacterium]|nr:ACT domain-containing protein [Halioglobus sp.]MCP5131880.1 ACT domain-containing protein [Pseudomonadales bacterium]
METSYIVTFIGDDRPGLVEALSRVIENNQGNWLESRLSQLGGKFAGLVLVALPDENGEALEAELKTLSASGLSVRVTPATGMAATSRGRCITLTVIGPDRLGIVREISRALAQRQVNVIEMDSAVSSAPMSAELIFTARIDAEIPEHIDLDDLEDSLEEIANVMTLEIDLERSHS